MAMRYVYPTMIFLFFFLMAIMQSDRVYAAGSKDCGEIVSGSPLGPKPGPLSSQNGFVTLQETDRVRITVESQGQTIDLTGFVIKVDRPRFMQLVSIEGHLIGVELLDEESYVDIWIEGKYLGGTLQSITASSDLDEKERYLAFLIAWRQQMEQPSWRRQFFGSDANVDNAVARDIRKADEDIQQLRRMPEFSPDLSIRIRTVLALGRALGADSYYTQVLIGHMLTRYAYQIETLDFRTGDIYLGGTPDYLLALQLGEFLFTGQYGNKPFQVGLELLRIVRDPINSDWYPRHVDVAVNLSDSGKHAGKIFLDTIDRLAGLNR